MIAVPSHRFPDWIKFAEGMSVKLHCNRHALDAWWHNISTRGVSAFDEKRASFCEALK